MNILDKIKNLLHSSEIQETPLDQLTDVNEKEILWHEVKTPLINILHILKSVDNEDISDNLRKQLSLINNNASYANNLLSGLTKNRCKKDFSYPYFEKVLHDLCHVWKIKCDRKGIQFSSSIDVKKSNSFNGNTTQIIQVLENIFQNSLNNTIKGNIFFYAYEIQTYLEFIIKDTGTGIDEISLKDISKFKVKSSQSTGTGIGLYVCNSIINKLNGKIDVHSKVNQGTSIKVKLPIKMFNNESTITEILFDKLNILILDDDKICLKATKSLLLNYFKNIYISDNLDEAKKIYKDNQINIVLFDYYYDAFFVEDIIMGISPTKSPATKFINITSHIEPLTKYRLLLHGVKESIEKPILISSMHRVLTSSKKIIPKNIIFHKQKTLKDLNYNNNILNDILDELIVDISNQVKDLKYGLINNDYDYIYNLLHKMMGTCSYLSLPLLKAIVSRGQYLLKKSRIDLMCVIIEEIEIYNALLRKTLFSNIVNQK